MFLSIISRVPPFLYVVTFSYRLSIFLYFPMNLNFFMLLDFPLPLSMFSSRLRSSLPLSASPSPLPRPLQLSQAQYTKLRPLHLPLVIFLPVPSSSLYPLPLPHIVSPILIISPLLAVFSLPLSLRLSPHSPSFFLFWFSSSFPTFAFVWLSCDLVTSELLPPLVSLVVLGLHLLLVFAVDVNVFVSTTKLS